MISSRKINEDLAQIASPEPYALTSTLFTRSKNIRSSNLFRSDPHKIRHVSVDLTQPPDYTLLINNTYPNKTYNHFLNMVINTPDIVLEEKCTKDIAEEVRNNPWKRYSIFTDFNKKDQKTDKNNSEEAVKDTNALSVQTTFSLILDHEVDNKYNKEPKKIEEPSFLTSEPIDPEQLTEEQVRCLVETKMKNLENFNNKLQKREELNVIKRYGLNEKTIEILTRFQKRFRGWILKKKFFQALRMNDYIEHKKNYLALKKSLQRFEKRHKEKPFSKYYDDNVDVFNEKK